MASSAPQATWVSKKAKILRILAWCTFGLSATLAYIYAYWVLSNPGIGDTFDPQTGPITIYSWYEPGTERLYTVILLGLLLWQILLFLARKIEANPLKMSEKS
jgi:hypothetical protein